MTKDTREAINEAGTDAAAGVAAGLALGASPTVQKHDDGRPFAFVPEGLEYRDLETMLPAPLRLRQSIALDTPQSFADYVNLFADKSRTIIIASKDASLLTASLDYHAAPDKPSWTGHKATCLLKKTQPWMDWTAKNNVGMNQADFAQFLEDHLPEIAKPDGGLLVEIARTFEAKKNVAFKSHVRATDGSVNFAYDEDVQGTAKAGQVKIPTEFVLVLTPYYGSKQAEVTARLRYRIEAGGVLKLTFQLIRVEDVLETAFGDVVASVRELTSATVRAVVLGSINSL